MIRTAHAKWNGDLPTGSGVISTQSKTLDSTQYSFKTRFADGVGTNPEELIAAAHAGCFSMAFALMLDMAGHKAESVSTDAKLTFEEVDGNWTITTITLTTVGSVPGITNEKFQGIALKAKEGCPISRVLNTDIRLEASLA
jgi:lipoyl-dependent peroxiredoxin